jgi:predicted nucleic acid-binding protein
MILYLDTSALVKAYITEKSSEEVASVIHRADIIATHRIAFVEAHAAFSRLKREKKITEQMFESIKSVFVADWEDYMQIENTHMLMQRAVELADAFALRAYDSVHLAASVMLYRESRQPVIFACFDQHLNKAAKILGMDLL